MIFAAPWVLVALAVLPALWWLLRVTPPAPRVQDFPAIRLLIGLRPREETAARTPLWLLLMRVLAAGLLIVGLAGPVLDAAGALVGTGPLVLVVDDGWAAAPDWAARIAAADAALDRAERAGRSAALLTTARSGQDAAPTLSPVMPIADLRPRLAALHPLPWPPDHAAAAQALRGVSGTVVYIADGVAAAGDEAFHTALAAIGSVTEIAPAAPTAPMLLQPRAEADRLVARVAMLPEPVATDLAVLAQSGDGRTLARATAHAAQGATEAEMPIVLPPELRNRLTRLVLEGPASAGATLLLDEGFRRRPVGLVTAEAGADTPLVGSLYYLERALAPFTELRRADLHTLLQREIAVIVLADRPLAPSEIPELQKWVQNGGLLLRFAGPRSADTTDDLGQPANPDPLMPERLLAEDRQLGGALSWSQPAKLSAFPANSPFVGLTVPAEVTVNRQVLAEPSAQLADHTWARLQDGTPLVTEASRGAGRIVLFHVTANADWSNLPLSGLFPDMLRRLVALSAGVSAAPDAAPLSPAETLDGFGVLGPPPPAAAGLPAADFAKTAVSPQHPPGLYGPQAGRRALNLSSAMGKLDAAAPVPNAARQDLAGGVHERAIGAWLVAAGLALLAFDLLIALRLRGLLRPAAAAAMLLLVAALPAHAQLPSPPWRAALETRLAYVVSDDPAIDDISRAGLLGLATYVNARTAAHLADPAGVRPGTDDLSFYPLLYWPITPGQVPSGAAITAMNAFMRDGGIILIDSRGDQAALRTAAAGLAIPPLTPLTTEHVLSRAFYLLSQYPGRTDGDTVWVQRQGDRSNDDVSPVVIGSHDWAAAWAIDSAGRNTVAIDGSPRQRTLAYRFGVNLVIYALTGNYKGDQVHVPHILERLGQ
ncbi:DUF4159 domain-containing protein [Acidisphaera sp. L21]|uniref:DUF4159 domain-containing protein n=1 Tax=Acidisphaera sp. L21 TaxID=1641851 RepID=UPI00131E867C|nr:DUF4159 domain-containing protein [Acidisphaera sp. L21]